MIRMPCPILFALLGLWQEKAIVKGALDSRFLLIKGDVPRN